MIDLFCENFSQKRKLQFLLLCDAYNYNINAYSYRVWSSGVRTNYFVCGYHESVI